MGKLKPKSILLHIVAIAVILILNGCSTLPQKPVNIIDKEPETIEKEEQRKKEAKRKSATVEWLQKPIADEILFDLEKRGKEGEYLMNFPNEIEIPKFIDAMMTGVFKLNYMLTDQVKQQKKKFSIKMTEHLSKAETFKVFEKILEIHNIKIEKEANTYIFTVARKTKMTLKGPIVFGRKPPHKLAINDSDEITYLIPFDNINPAILQTLIRKQLTPPSTVDTVKGQNLLLVSGRFGEVKYVLTLIDLIDRAQFKEKSIVMLHPKYWNIDDFQEKVKELLEAEGMDWKTAEQTKSLVFIPIENLGYILVISSSKSWVERVIYWLKKLDVPDAAGESKKVFHYKLKNVEVDSVLKVLEDLESQTSSSRSRRSSGPRRSPGPGPGPSPAMRSSSSGKTLIPIKETNTIVIVANPVEYQKYVDVLKAIDVPRNQVFVEVIIGEVSVDESSQLGLEFWINKYLYKTEFGTRGGLGVFKPGNEGAVQIPAGSNVHLRGILPGTEYELLINALITNSKINIISSPKLTVVENEEAEIRVGSDVPTIAGSSGLGGGLSGGTSGGTGTQTGQQSSYYYPYQSIQYVKTGIGFKIKASILTDNKIALEIDQEISEAQENQKSAISSPEILTREIKTTMIVNEGEIGFIGGLIQDKKTTAKSGIPVLSKIPLLGNLFKKTSKIHRKTELVFFINAKIIRKTNQMRQIVDEVKNIISEHSFLEAD